MEVVMSIRNPVAVLAAAVGRRLEIAAVVPVLLIAAATAHASPNTEAKQCVFGEYEASAVAPYRAEERLGFSTYTRLRGAQIFVPAREGLTAEWLNLNVQRALAQPAAEGCRPNVADVNVNVVSAGPGFWVVLSTKDEHKAKALLEWARQVVPNRGAPVASAQR
jgi:hypothetical protein